MRESTLLAHLSLTEDALRSERIRIADQQKLMGKLRLEGVNLGTAGQRLQSMKDNLCALERHRDRLIEELGLVAHPPTPTYLR